MALMKYWFSAKQKRMRDALAGVRTFVYVGDTWVEYTQSTESSDVPGAWNDFKLIAEGNDLPCRMVPAALEGVQTLRSRSREYLVPV